MSQVAARQLNTNGDSARVGTAEPVELFISIGTVKCIVYGCAIFMRRDGKAKATGTAADPAPAATDLADQARALLAALRAPLLTQFLGEWPTRSSARSVAPQSLPVLRWLPAAREAAPPFSARFIDALVACAAALAWRRSYTVAEAGTAFLDNYGWCEFLGISGPSRSERLACGVLLLGPNLIYPAHRHEAEEIYVPLAGTAAWQRGGLWTERAPGAVIHHARNEPHAMRTGTVPLLALYLWRSENLAQKSRLDPAAT
jgi:mannose-6-phosphate isomerase-like protein (cupin superfamily)